MSKGNPRLELSRLDNLLKSPVKTVAGSTGSPTIASHSRALFTWLAEEGGGILPKGQSPILSFGKTIKSQVAFPCWTSSSNLERQTS